MFPSHDHDFSASPSRLTSTDVEDNEPSSLIKHAKEPAAAEKEKEDASPSSPDDWSTPIAPSDETSPAFLSGRVIESGTFTPELSDVSSAPCHRSGDWSNSQNARSCDDSVAALGYRTPDVRAATPPFNSAWSTSSSLRTTASGRLRMASDIIQRFESSQSASFREYRQWKETKWGEDTLDEVEFEDDDLNLELAIPKLFTSPVISLPSLGDLNVTLDELWSRTVACVISLFSMAVSGKYYLMRPKELLQAVRSSLTLWAPSLPEPPRGMEWFYRGYHSVVDNGVLSGTAEFIQSAAQEADRYLFREEDEDEAAASEDDEKEILQSSFSSTVANVFLTIVAAIVGTLSILLLTLAMLLKLISEKSPRATGFVGRFVEVFVTNLTDLTAFLLTSGPLKVCLKFLNRLWQADPSPARSPSRHKGRTPDLLVCSPRRPKLPCSPSSAWSRSTTVKARQSTSVERKES